jgi:hypothetical protein
MVGPTCGIIDLRPAAELVENIPGSTSTPVHAHPDLVVESPEANRIVAGQVVICRDVHDMHLARREPA